MSTQNLLKELEDTHNECFKMLDKIHWYNKGRINQLDKLIKFQKMSKDDKIGYAIKNLYN